MCKPWKANGGTHLVSRFAPGDMRRLQDRDKPVHEIVADTEDDTIHPAETRLLDYEALQEAIGNDDMTRPEDLH